MIKIYVPKAAENSLVTEDMGIVDRFLNYNSSSSQVSFCESPDVADLIIIFQGWSFKLPSYARELLENQLFSQHASKIYVVNYDSTVGEGFLPGCYVSLNRSNYDSTRFRACAYPKTYNEHVGESTTSRERSPYLFSFRGTLHSHPVRTKMFESLKGVENSLMIDNTKAFHTHTDQEKRQYVEDLINSQFVLCPRGTSPNSYRLFEAMSLGRCPVIISDEWVETPGPDWASCSIRVPENQVSDIEKLLKDRALQAQSLGQNALNEWLRYFEESAKNKCYLAQILALYHQAKPPTMSLSEYQKHWRSNRFLTANNWSLKQKIMRRLRL